jgi:hypothetical protein
LNFGFDNSRKDDVWDGLGGRMGCFYIQTVKEPSLALAHRLGAESLLEENRQQFSNCGETSKITTVDQRTPARLGDKDRIARGYLHD